MSYLIENQEIIILAKERSERLRRLRNLANLSRKELCDGASININTYIGYEVGKYGGITLKGAVKVIDYLIQKGVSSSVEWLMHGTGSPPVVAFEGLDLEKQTSMITLSHDLSALSATFKLIKKSLNENKIIQKYQKDEELSLLMALLDGVEEKLSSCVLMAKEIQ